MKVLFIFSMLIVSSMASAQNQRNPKISNYVTPNFFTISQLYKKASYVEAQCLKIAERSDHSSLDFNFVQRQKLVCMFNQISKVNYEAGTLLIENSNMCAVKQITSADLCRTGKTTTFADVIALRFATGDKARKMKRACQRSRAICNDIRTLSSNMSDGARFDIGIAIDSLTSALHQNWALKNIK